MLTEVDKAQMSDGTVPVRAAAGMSCRSEAAVMLRAPLAVPGAAAVRVSRAGVEVGRAYLELTGYAKAVRLGRE